MLTVFGIDITATFASGKNKGSKVSLPSKTLTFSMTRRKVGSTSMKMVQTRALVTVASLPSLKVLLDLNSDNLEFV